MDLSIIIVNYKSAAKLENCLQSLAVADFGNIDYEIIVVENASGDNLESLVARFSSVRLLRSPQNLGMGGGNNLGIKASRGRFILVANPDLVFSTAAIKQMYEYFHVHPEIGVLGPKLLNPDGSLQYSCARFPNFFLPVIRRTAVGRYLPVLIDRYLMRREGHNEIRVVDWVLGACLLVRRNELFVAGNLFDERFFMYFEDVDLCRRARQLGKQVVYYPPALVIHDHMRDSARLPWYQAVFSDKLAKAHLNSWWKYFKKWGLR